jgi:hypothetical protein
VDRIDNRVNIKSGVVAQRIRWRSARAPPAFQLGRWAIDEINLAFFTSGSSAMTL